MCVHVSMCEREREKGMVEIEKRLFFYKCVILHAMTRNN